MVDYGKAAGKLIEKCDNLKAENKRLREKYMILEEQSQRQIATISKKLVGFSMCITELRKQALKETDAQNTKDE